MKFDTPATTNPIDQMRVVGQPLDRIDGRLKVTGQALYAYEQPSTGAPAAYGQVVGAAIARGRVLSMDLAAARAAPGVLAIVTAATAGRLGKGPRNTAPLLGGPEVAHYHQALALVVAERFEQARAAAELVKVVYETTPGRYDLAAERAAGRSVAYKPVQSKPESRVGQFDSAYAQAPVQVDAEYHTPDQSHAMMEPHATVARWDGDRLTAWTSNQMVDWAVTDLAQTLRLPKSKIRLVSAFVGGGFGGKLFLRADLLLAALGARATGRTVKVALQRPLIANNTTHRPATLQRVRLGAQADGRLLAIGHESWSGDQPGGQPELAVDQTRLLYAAAHRHTLTRLAELHLPEGNAMRAPGEAPGLMALEIAMDELAERLGMDPVALRVVNDTQNDPESPVPRPFSQRQLVQCLQLGAQRFGWQARRAQPAQVRDGRWLVGLGVAAAMRNNIPMPSAARVRLSSQGRLTVETDMTDIGTGSYTIIAQTAAEMMGLSIDQVTVRLGDSRFPVSAGSGGQWGGNSATAGVYAACVQLRSQVARRLGVAANQVRFEQGLVSAPGLAGGAVPLGQAAGRAGLVAEDTMTYGDLAKRYQQTTFGAHFVEVGVDADTAEVRVRRMLAVCAAGRILNPKSARSQVIGAMTMGIGAAFMEELAVDKRRGFFVNHDLASYEVPVHADLPSQEVVFLDETDPTSSPMKAKGVGELGLCGVAAALANAVHNATGVRVRHFPITLDKLLPHLPAQA